MGFDFLLDRSVTSMLKDLEKLYISTIRKISRGIRISWSRGSKIKDLLSFLINGAIFGHFWSYRKSGQCDPTTGFDPKTQLSNDFSVF